MASAVNHDEDDDDDPVTAEYSVYITPPQLEKLYLLQFPTRDREMPYNERQRNTPLNMRMKPQTGFVEMDVPISAHFHYNRNKAKAWGEALQKSATEGAHGHGLAAGFATVIGQRASGRAAASAETGARGGAAGGLEKREQNDGGGTELLHQTLGGQILKEQDGKPSYMLGAFRGDELHLTKIEGIVQMRPQFHHLDAKTQVERNKARRDREAEVPRPMEQARAVQMINRAADADSFESGTTKELLQAAQDESWVTLQYYDEDDEQAYIKYHERMFVQHTNAAPELTASMTNDQYLDRISASRFGPVLQQKAKTRARRQEANQVSESSEDSERDDGTN